MTLDLASGPVSKTLIVFVLPMATANLLQTAYSIVSMMVMGRFVGSTGLTAVSIGSEIITTLTFVAMGICSAGQIIISQFMGAGDRKSVSRTIGTMFTVMLLTPIVLSVVCIISVNTVLRLLNTPAEAFQMAREYCILCFAGLFFIFGYNMVSAILRGMGDSRHPLVFIAIASVSNLILAFIFVAGLGWEAYGAALATVTGQAISFIASIVLLYKRKEEFGFDFKLRSFKVDGFILRRLMRLGIPLCIQSAAINLSFMYVNSYIYAYGVVVTAVSSIGSRLGHIMNVVCGSLSTGGGTMVGQSLGAGRTERVPILIRFSLVVNIVFSLLFSALIALIPRQLFGLFNSDTEVLDMAIIYVAPAIVNNIGFALRAPYFSLINGVGHAKLNLAVGLLDGVVGRVGLALLLGISVGMGVTGFWYGSALAGYIPFIVGVIYYASGKWKTQKLLISR